MNKGKISKTEKNIDGYPITRSYKYLGIHIDDKMSPQKSMNIQTNKLKIYISRNK